MYLYVMCYELTKHSEFQLPTNMDISYSECSSNGGSSKGSCAAGFGVCCVFTINSDSSLTVNYNDTYIQNPGYPSTYTGTSSLTYTINKCANST